MTRSLQRSLRERTGESLFLHEGWWVILSKIRSSPLARYGKQFVPIEDVNDDDMKYSPGSKTMQLIGFADAAALRKDQRYLFLKDPQVCRELRPRCCRRDRKGGRVHLPYTPNSLHTEFACVCAGAAP